MSTMYIDGSGNVYKVAGVGSKGKDGTNGRNGTDGKSAYQQAVLGGFTGTEQQFNIALANILKYQNKAKNYKILVDTSSWASVSGYFQKTLSVSGLKANSNVFVSIATDNTPANYEMAASLFLVPIEQGANSIKLRAKKKPTTSFYIAILELEV